MKKVTIVFVGHKLCPDLHAFGLSIGAQFRNAHLVEGVEQCDFVAGYPIPEQYHGHTIHPNWQEYLDSLVEEGGVSGVNLMGDDVLDALKEQGPLDPPQDSASDEVEVTLEYLESLTKKQMIELADEQEIELTSADKKSAESLREALIEAFEL